MPEDELNKLLQECDRQAKQCEKVKKQLELIIKQAPAYKEHPFKSDKVWEDVAHACGKDKLDDLAGRLGLNTGKDNPRTIFLTALTTIETYDLGWEIILGTRTRHTQEHQRIYKVESEINEEISQAIANAIVCFRGTRLMEAENVCNRKTHKPFYSFVSITIDLLVAKWFAAPPDRLFAGDGTVMVFDASRVRDMGAEPAIYSIASDVLRLERETESVHRTFPLAFAEEMQIHIDDKWPPEAADALLAIATIGEPSARIADRIDALCVPRIPLHGG